MKRGRGWDTDRRGTPTNQPPSRHGHPRQLGTPFAISFPRERRGVRHGLRTPHAPHPAGSGRRRPGRRDEGRLAAALWMPIRPPTPLSGPPRAVATPPASVLADAERFSVAPPLTQAGATGTARMCSFQEKETGSNSYCRCRHCCRHCRRCGCRRETHQNETPDGDIHRSILAQLPRFQWQLLAGCMTCHTLHVYTWEGY